MFQSIFQSLRLYFRVHVPEYTAIFQNVLTCCLKAALHMWYLHKDVLMFGKYIGKKHMVQFYCRTVASLSCETLRKSGPTMGVFQPVFRTFLEQFTFRTPTHSDICTGSNKITIFYKIHIFCCFLLDILHSL